MKDMKKIILLSVVLLAACQPSDADSDLSVAPQEIETTPLTEDKSVPKDGAVTIVLRNPVSETRACIVPIRIENGLEEDVNVTMIGFSVTGPGEDTTGNMFAPVAAPGTASEARVILEGQSCDAFDTVTVPEVLCKAGEDNCRAKVKFEDGDELSFSQSG